MQSTEARGAVTYVHGGGGAIMTMVSGRRRLLLAEVEEGQAHREEQSWQLTARRYVSIGGDRAKATRGRSMAAQTEAQPDTIAVRIDDHVARTRGP